MNDKVPTKPGDGSLPSWGVWGVLFVGLGGALLVRMGYDLGMDQSRKILRRHDKDVRRMFKREKHIYREQRKKEEQERKRDKVNNRWQWISFQNRGEET